MATSIKKYMSEIKKKKILIYNNSVEKINLKIL